MGTEQENRLARQARREERWREKQQQLAREWEADQRQYVLREQRKREKQQPGSAPGQTWYMTSPEPPSEGSRRLLQAIWDLSRSRRGKQTEWPTLAALYQPEATSPRFLAGEAESLLAQIPAGFINGIGPDGRRNPGDSKELSLTVAGVAACRDTEKILLLFLRFIQHVIYLELNWRVSNPGIGDVFDSTFGTSFRNSGTRYLTSDAQFIRYDPTFPKLSRQRGELLSRLHLILASEPGLWVKITGYYRGDWKVTFDRRIRYFKGIRNLDDYWACRFKPWESSDRIPYPVVPGSSTLDQGRQLQLLRDHPDLLADVLLGRIFDCCSGLTRVVSCPKVNPDIDSTLIRQALRRLEARGRIRIPNVESSPGLPNLMLTNEGAEYTSAFRLCWADRILRDNAARNALLAWLYDHRIRAESPPHMDEILNDFRRFYGGQFFSLRDINDAASYLQDKHLIGEVSANRKRITASGMDCIEQGGDVAEYGKRHHVEAKGDVVIGDKYEAHGNAQIGAMGRGANVTTVSFNSLAGEIREVDLASLISQLQSLRAEMRAQATTTEDDQAVVAVGQAISAAEQGDTSSLFAHLKSSGKWALNLATAIGAELAAAVLKSVIGF